MIPVGASAPSGLRRGGRRASFSHRCPIFEGVGNWANARKESNPLVALGLVMVVMVAGVILNRQPRHRNPWATSP